MNKILLNLIELKNELKENLHITQMENMNLVVKHSY